MARACDHSFAKWNDTGLALTFADVTLKSGYSEILPKDVSLETYFSRRIKLKIPIVSSPMEITKSKMAIAIAKLGGLGIIHRNLTLEEQRGEVKKVKLSGMVLRPETFTDTTTIENLKKEHEGKRYKFHSFPVVSSVDGKIVGLITQRNFATRDNLDRPISKIMTPLSKLVWLPPDATIDMAYRTMVEKDKKIIPLIDEAGFLRGMYLRSDIDDRFASGAIMHNTDSKGRFVVGAAVGTGPEALERVALLLENQEMGPNVIVIDAAHGDTLSVKHMLQEIKFAYDIDVVAGNISEGQSAKNLVDVGADGIRGGQGPGSICTTRDIAGYGRPQISAIYDMVKATEESGIPVCADGGITRPGDITKAIGAGAHCVMLGGLLAGTDEAPGEVVLWSGSPMKFYRGMGSRSAMEMRLQNRYHETGSGKFVPEGVEGYVPYTGTLESVIDRLTGGLRSGMGAIGATTIEDLRKKADFYWITRAGIEESHPHDIQLAEFPNLRSGRA